MLTDHVRQWSRGIVNPITRFMRWTGASPNTITIIGFSLSVGVAFLLAQGYTRLGGALLILAATFDAIDGTLARMSSQATRFGAFLDSTLDRLSEAAVFLGVLVYFHRQGAGTEVILTYATIVGSLMVSYARARAEGIGVSVRGGLLTRLERVVILIIFLILNQLTVGLWILALLSNFTALQRIWLVWRATRANHGERRPDR